MILEGAFPGHVQSTDESGMTVSEVEKMILEWL